MLVCKQSRQHCTFFPPAVLFVILIMVTSAPAAAGTAGQAKVDRLVMGLILPYRDYMRPWINRDRRTTISSMTRRLSGCLRWTPRPGKYNPWLAESAEMAPDGRSWRIKLRKGVQFHHGYGEFTAKDVVHNHALWCDDKYPGRKDPPSSGYRNGICMVQRIEVVNDHEIVMHCKVVCVDVEFYYSSASNVMMFSKEQWDTEGEMGYESKPAGTGPYIFKERVLGRYCAVRTRPDAALEAGRGGLEGAPDDLDARRTDALCATAGGGDATSPRSTRTSSIEAGRQGL